MPKPSWAWAWAWVWTGLLFPLAAIGAGSPCPDRGPEFFEREGYKVRRAYVSGFWLLTRSLNSSMGPLSGLEGTPFTNAAMMERWRALRDTLLRAPMLFDSLVSGTVVVPRLANCSGEGSAKTLDIEYWVFTTKVPLATVRTMESRDLERTSPSEALALAPAKTQVRVTPSLGYDASQNFWAGGQLEARMPWAGARFQLNGQGSSEALLAGTSLSGTRDSDQGWLRQLSWRGGFEYVNRPSDRTALESGRGLGQLSMVTAPVGAVGALFRFGTLFEGGHQRTALEQTALPADSLAAARFANWRSYAGVSLRRGRQSAAASYGLLLGRTGAGQLVDYRKQVVDTAYDTRFFRFVRGPAELRTQFTAGWLTQRGPTPVSERFFGGSVEMPFMPGSEWVIRANPVMRGIPAYRLNRTADSRVPGADKFAVVNVTLAIPVFGIPLIPAEASQSPEIREKVEGFVSEGSDGLIPIYELDDPAQKQLFATRREPFSRTTAALEQRIAALKTAVPEPLKPAYDLCAEKSSDLAADAVSITKTTPWRTFTRDDPEERGIPVIVDVCLDKLNGQMRDPEVTRLGDDLREHLKVIADQVAKIDRPRAARLAEQTMAFPRSVIRTIFDEMTLLAVSPVAIFDAGRIGPATDGLPSSRYSLGGGLRFTLASSVSFELGYAWNLRPRAWEGRGALFFAIRFIDLFGK